MAGMLLATPVDVNQSNQKALDFLNAKFPTLESSSSLSDTASELLEQHNQLQQELEQSTLDLNNFIRESLDKAHQLLATAKETALARYSLSDDINSLKEELISSTSKESLSSTTTILEDLEALHERLEQLQEARTYLRVVERGVMLSEAAIHSFKAPRGSTPLAGFSKASLSDYIELNNFVVSVSEACSKGQNPVEPAIVTFLDGLRSRTWKEIKSTQSSNLLAAADHIKWPMKVDWASYPPAERKDFQDTFISLLKLQEFGENVHGNSPNQHGDNIEKPGLYPLQTLVQPISARFKFHFEGTRPTNRLDKPEWYFTHVLNIMHEHKPFVETVIQPLLASSAFAHINALHEFTYTLLPILSRKLKRTVPSLLPHPPLLAHTVYQTLIFDSSLKEEGFNLEGTSTTRNKDKEMNTHWKGLSEVILGRMDWFEVWLGGESKFADETFNEIISSPDAWQLVADSDEVKGDDEVELRPTSSARRVKALIEQVTERYQHLPEFAHRLQFLITIQLPILTAYVSRIVSSLEAYETLSSSFMRAVPGALTGPGGTYYSGGGDTRRMTSGVEGLGRLFKAFVSAEWMRLALEAWGEELFFLELWAEINEKPGLRDRFASNSAIPSLKDGTSNQGTIFDKLAKDYGAAAVRAEDMIIKQMCNEVEGELKEWLNTSWENEETEESNTTATSSIPTIILKPLTSLSTCLAFLARSLPPTQLSVSYKRVASHISNFLFQRLIYHRSRGRMSPSNGRVLYSILDLFENTCEHALRGKMRRAGIVRVWSKLRDASGLLSIGEGQIGGVIGMVFDAGEAEYKETMESLGLGDSLSWDEAQAVLRARVDVRRS